MEGGEASVTRVLQKAESGELLSASDEKILLREAEIGRETRGQLERRVPPLIRRMWEEERGEGNVEERRRAVRFVGMIQDILPTEFFLGKPYKEQEDVSEESDAPPSASQLQHLTERQRMVVVPLPGTTDWFRQVLNGDGNDEDGVDVGTLKAGSEAHSSRKRPLDSTCGTNTPALECHCAVRRKTTAAEPACPALGTPRKVMSSTSANGSPQGGSALPSVAAPPILSCADKPGVSSHNSDLPAASLSSSNMTSWWPAGCMGSDHAQGPVLANRYPRQEDCSQDSLRLNGVLEFIGFLEVPSALPEPVHTAPLQRHEVAMLHDIHDDHDYDSSVSVPPPSTLPRIHVLCYQPLDLDRIILSCPPTLPVENEAASDRALTMQMLEQLLFSSSFCAPANQQTAAEALLMLLVSTGEPRRESTTSMPHERLLGAASLHFSSTHPKDLVRRLTTILRHCLPSVVLWDLSSDDNCVLPTQNSHGRLEPSPAQLPQGSCLIVLVPTQGPADERFLSLLSRMTKTHTLPYRFGGGIQYDFLTDYRIIVVTSFGEENQLPCTLSMALSDNNDRSSKAMEAKTNTEPTPHFTPAHWNRVRHYLARCRRGPSPQAQRSAVELPVDVLRRAESYFVDRRVQARKDCEEELPGEDDLHRWLTLTRLMARSRRGYTTADQGNSCNCTVEDWEGALRLDDAMNVLATTK